MWTNMSILGIFHRNKKQEEINKNTESVTDWPDHVITVDGKKFDDFIQKYPLSLVDFWAPWCAPCRVMTPRLRRLSKVYREKVAFGKLNTQKNQDIAKKYKVMGIPHLIFFSYGKKISSITGIKSVGNLKDVIDDILKKV
jgi:thioredoxin 1